MARIVKAEYHERIDEVHWTLRLADGQPYYLKWPRKSYGEALGIRNKDGSWADIPVKVLLGYTDHTSGRKYPNHLKQMVGKDFTLRREIMQQQPVDMKREHADAEMLAFSEMMESRSGSHSVGESGLFYKRNEKWVR